jgi:hypothetical protein
MQVELSSTGSFVEKKIKIKYEKSKENEGSRENLVRLRVLAELLHRN